MTKDATVYGMSLFNSPQSAREEMHKAIFDGLSKGHLQPVIRKTLPLVDAPTSHHEVIESRALGKIVLVP